MEQPPLFCWVIQAQHDLTTEVPDIDYAHYTHCQRSRSPSYEKKLFVEAVNASSINVARG